MNFKEFRIGDLFDWKNGNTDIKKEHINGKGLPVVSSGVENMGVIGYTDIEARILPSNTITVDMFGNVFFRDFEYKEVTHARVFTLIPKNFSLTVETGLYFVTSLKWLPEIFSYSNMCSFAKIKDLKITLPVTQAGEIDWQFMHERISELMHERISALDAYLKAAGLNDWELTDEDKNILAEEKIFKEFALGELFEIYSPKKRFNANTIKFDGKYPYVARGSSNNGIRGYITEDEKYLSPARSLSFGQDTATVFYQPNAYFTGDKIKVMILKNRELNEELGTYFISSITKAFQLFSWGLTSFREEILKSTKITLPINSVGEIDFEYMEKYIRAIEKKVIAGVVKYKDAVIEATKKIVEE